MQAHIENWIIGLLADMDNMLMPIQGSKLAREIKGELAGNILHVLKQRGLINDA